MPDLVKAQAVLKDLQQLIHAEYLQPSVSLLAMIQVRLQLLEDALGQHSANHG